MEREKGINEVEGTDRKSRWTGEGGGGSVRLFCQLRQLCVVSGYHRNMGHLRVDCRPVVFAHPVTLACPYPVEDQ